MKPAIPNLLTIVAAAGVSFLVARWVSPTPSANVSVQAPPREVAAPHVPAALGASRKPIGPIPDAQQPPEPIEERSNEERVADFRRGLEERLASVPRDTASADKFREVIQAELRNGQEEFPQALHARVSCGLGICQIRITHPDPGSAQRFHGALMAGELLNRPELLNQDNGCNLHAFSGQGEAPEDTFYIECREGRQ